MTKINSLERDALESALSGADPWKEQLRRQVERLTVSRRENTGVGFYTYFTLPSDVPAVSIPKEYEKLPIETVANHPLISGGVAFLVWLQDGHIHMLEGAAGVAWPLNDNEFRFAPRGERD